MELLAREGADAKDPSRRGQGRLVDSAEKILLGDGEAVPVKFELPPSELGQHVLCLRVKAPPRAVVRRRPTNSWKARWTSPTTRRTCSCWPAVRCAIISISARCCSATNR